MEQTQEIQKHRIQMMAEKERREREQQEANQAMLQNKREHDLKVHKIKIPLPFNNLYFLSLLHSSTKHSRRRPNELIRRPKSCNSSSEIRLQRKKSSRRQKRGRRKK